MRSFVQAQTLVIQSSLKIGENCLVPSMFCKKFCLLSPVMLYVAADIKIALYLYCVLYK